VIALQNRGDLCLAQAIAIDGQRTVDGADAVEAPQSQSSRLIGKHGQTSDGLADGGDLVQDLRGYGAGWLVDGFCHAPSPPSKAPALLHDSIQVPASNGWESSPLE